MKANLAQKYKEIQWTSIFNHWLHEGENRFDGSFYCGDSVQSFVVLDSFKGKMSEIGDYSSNTFYPGRFKRVWVDPLRGKPFYTGAQILEAYPSTDKYLSENKLNNSDTYKVKKNQILVTRSGTIGNITIATSTLEDQYVTEDAIRITPKLNAPYGYIYAFLKSKIGNPLIQQSTFGAVIDHIEPNHIDSIKLPLLKNNEIESIHNDIVKAFSLREKANILIDESDNLFYQLLKLPRILDNDVAFYNKSKEKVWEIDSWSSRFRLDANYYSPIVDLVKLKYRQAKLLTEPLGDKNDIYELPTYKRIYLEKGHGLPFLSGKNLSEYQFTDLKHLSRIPIKNVDKYLIHEGMLLITMRGTCGNTRLIDSSLNGFGASHNIMRLKPGKEYVGGYIYTFLRSDYGRYQMNSKILGSVVDVLTPEDCQEILIPFVSKEIQSKIGDKAQKAFELRTEANNIENKAIEYLEEQIKAGD